MGKYQPFNDLPASQFQLLVDDIARHGVLLPILVDEDGKTIDGHQRRRAAAEAGVECPQIVVEGLTEDEKQTLALTLNLFRRHLVGVERTKAIAQLANLGLSTRRIGSLLGLSKSTIHRDLADVEDRPDTVTGAGGRPYPAQRPPVVPDGTTEDPPLGIDPETGEVVDDDRSTEDVPQLNTPPAPREPETSEQRDAREAEERRVGRNVAFGKYLIGLWALLGDGEKPVQQLLEGWVPEECPMWLVDAHKPVFTADGIRAVAAVMEKLASEWESRV